MSDEQQKFSEFMQGAGFSVESGKKNIVSVFQLSPGDICHFTYNGKVSIIFITSTKKARTGFYRARNTKNLLITGFKLSEIQDVEEGMKLLIKNLIYNKRRQNNYKKSSNRTPISTRVLNKMGNNIPGDRIAKSESRALIAVAGKGSFRTYIFSKTKRMRKYTVEESLDLDLG